MPVQTVINFYEGSYQFNTIKTDLNVNPSFIEFKLAMQFEFRPTTETLWATVTTEGVETRFKLIYGSGLEEIILK